MSARLNIMRKIDSKPRVAVIRCPDYEPENLSRSIRSSLDLIGGLSAFLKPHSRVFVKVNLLSFSAPPEKAIYTHPLFTQEVLRLFKDHDVDITLGDDLFSNEKDCFSSNGYRRVCAELGVRLVNLKETGFAEVSVRGKVLEKAFVARPVLEADVIVDLPKLKTHSFTIFTGAVKNMFGVIPHGLRLDCHRRFIRNDLFSEMLVDVFSCALPHLSIMDAIIGLEGEGPSAGSPKEIGLVLASSDGVALDAVAARIVGHDPLRIYTTYYAHERELGIGDIGLIEITGEQVKDVEVKDFKPSVVAVSLFRRRLPSLLYAYVQGQLALIPEVIGASCTACRECMTICPAKAISLVRRGAWVNEKKCIHCLCCHEVCRFKAIRLKQLPVGRLLRRADAIYRMVASAISRIF
jgi:uncharacterized protein (DUF362 family)/Pyruvate/2-oxoacid:ferredoxin oxidoreductase delta subunit